MEKVTPSHGVRVPERLLLDSGLTASAKLVWMAIGIAPSPAGRSSSQTSAIASITGLSYPTVRDAFDRLRQAGWIELSGKRHYHVADIPPGSFIVVPRTLIVSRDLRPTDKSLYGILMIAASGPRRRGGKFTCAGLAQMTGWGVNRIRRSVQVLRATGWLRLGRESRLAPIRFVLRDPVAERNVVELRRMKRRILKAEFKGEAIMREFLTLIVDSDEYEDNAAPGFLVNPFTDERMELDRYYPPRAAFEFNGPQHYGPTEMYPDDVDKQRGRDHIKRGICEARGIELRIVHAEDLSLAAMQNKVAGLLPLRDLSACGPQIEYLESVARVYRRTAKRIPHNPVRV